MSDSEGCPGGCGLCTCCHWHPVNEEGKPIGDNVGEYIYYCEGCDDYWVDFGWDGEWLFRENVSHSPDKK